METLSLRRGDGEVMIAPTVGGALLSWTDRGQSILRPPLPLALELGLVRSCGAFPLVPFSNRINRGVFAFDGQLHALPAIFGGHAIHGVGWKRAWRVVASSATEATLALDHTPDELWPFAFHVEQHVVLGGDALTWGMRLTSLHDGPAPAGLGFHPYFPRGTGATLRFAAGGVWLSAPDSIPMRHAAIPQEWDHAAGRVVGSTIVHLDNPCFTGWRQPAVIEYAEHQLVVTADRDSLFRFLIAFTPEDKDFFAIEPVSHMNDGVNRMDGDVDHGIVTLQHGETLEGEMHIALRRS